MFEILKVSENAPMIDVFLPVGWDRIPDDQAGVYLMYSNEGDLLYIGKSTNIKARLRQHIKGDATSASFIRYLFRVEAYALSSELETDILETYLINTREPIFNSSKVMTYKSYGRDKNKNGFDARDMILSWRERLGNQTSFEIAENKNLKSKNLRSEYYSADVWYRSDGMRQLHRKGMMSWRHFEPIFENKENYRSPHRGEYKELWRRKNIKETISDIRWFMDKHGLSYLPDTTVHRFVRYNGLYLVKNYHKREDFAVVLREFGLVKTFGNLEVSEAVGVGRSSETGNRLNDAI